MNYFSSICIQLFLDYSTIFNMFLLHNNTMSPTNTVKKALYLEKKPIS